MGTKCALQAFYMRYLPGKVKWGVFADNPKRKTVFDEVKTWEDFPYAKDELVIVLSNLVNKSYVFSAG